MTTTATEVYAVMKRHPWSGDEAVRVFADKAAAEDHRDLLNGEPYDPDDVHDYYVGTLPFVA